MHGLRIFSRGGERMGFDFMVLRICWGRSRLGILHVFCQERFVCVRVCVCEMQQAAQIAVQLLHVTLLEA